MIFWRNLSSTKFANPRRCCASSGFRPSPTLGIRDAPFRSGSLIDRLHYIDFAFEQACSNQLRVMIKG